MVNDYLRQALKSAGLSQTAAALELTKELNRNIDKAAVNKMLSGKRDVTAAEFLTIARITQFPIPASFGVNVEQGAGFERASGRGPHNPDTAVPHTTGSEFLVRSTVEIALRLLGLDQLSPEARAVLSREVQEAHLARPARGLRLREEQKRRAVAFAEVRSAADKVARAIMPPKA